jgi:hypothetical protein
MPIAKEFAAWRARVLRSGDAAADVFEQLAAAGHDIPVTDEEWQWVGKKYGTSTQGVKNWDRDKHYVKAVRKQLMEQTESLPLSSVALEEGESLLEYLYRQSKINSTYWVEKSKVGGGCRKCLLSQPILPQSVQQWSISMTVLPKRMACKMALPTMTY